MQWGSSAELAKIHSWNHRQHAKNSFPPQAQYWGVLKILQGDFRVMFQKYVFKFRKLCHVIHCLDQSPFQDLWCYDFVWSFSDHLSLILFGSTCPLLCSSLILFYFLQKENHKINVAITAFGPGEKKKPFVSVNCLCFSKLLARSSQQKEKSFYRCPFTLGSLNSSPQFHYQLLFSER